MKIHFEEISQPSPEQIEPVRQALKRFNESQLGDYTPKLLLVTANSIDGSLIGGIHGWLQLGWLHIHLLWVDEAQRRRGIGSELLLRLENLAEANGIYRSRLVTSDVQLGFHLYRRCGYDIFAQVPLMPNHASGMNVCTEYLMWKYWTPSEQKTKRAES